jgi:Flp pilus assembly protein TadD
VGATEPFDVVSMFAGGPAEMRAYATASGSADILDDDRMRLEFSAPRELHNASAGANDASLASMARADDAPEFIRTRRDRATAAQWRGRADMMAKSDAYSIAYEDYIRALKIDPLDEASLKAFVRTAILTNRAQDALSWVKALTMGKTSVPARIAVSKLLAASSLKAEAVEAAVQACNERPLVPAGCEQLAARPAAAGDGVQLDSGVKTLSGVAPAAASTLYYTAVSAFLRGDAQAALDASGKAIAADATYAAAYDMAGAAHTRLGQADLAAKAFQTSLRFDPHDSTAYANLGLLALAAGDKAAARNYFAESLWLTPEDRTARDGLARAR